MVQQPSLEVKEPEMYNFTFNLPKLFSFFAGFCLADRRHHRSHKHSGEMVPGAVRLLLQLTQHNARSRRSGRLLHAPGNRCGPQMDGNGKLRQSGNPMIRKQLKTTTITSTTKKQ